MKLGLEPYIKSVYFFTVLETHFAKIQVGHTAVSEPLIAIAKSNGFEVESSDGKTVITAPLGKVTFKGNNNFTHISFSSETKPQLQLFKELYASRLASLDLGAEVKWDKTDTSTPLNQIRCEVSSYKKISKNFGRLTLSGDFNTFVSPVAGLHFRFLIGPKDSNYPSLDENGLTFWPGGLSKWHRPVFTVRKLGTNAERIDVDIALHSGGRTTEWLKNIKIGQKIAINGPSGSKMPKADKMFLLGDETAMPAILRIIDQTFAYQEVVAILALRDPEDLQSFTSNKKVSIEVIEMKEEKGLLNALENKIEIMSDSFLFFAAERLQATKARELLKSTKVSVKASRISAYWSRNL